jgi:hypothetical protein
MIRPPMLHNLEFYFPVDLFYQMPGCRPFRFNIAAFRRVRALWRIPLPTQYPLPLTHSSPHR